MGGDDDLDFESAMGGMDVRPMRGGPARAPRPEPTATPVGGKGKRGKGQAPGDAEPPPRDAVAPGVRRELEQSLLEIAALRAELASADAQASQAVADAQAARAALSKLEERVAGLETERDEALAQYEAAARERKAVQQRLAEAQERGRSQSRSRPSVDSLLTARGLADEGERELVFQGWLDKGRLAEWLAAVDSDDATELRRFIDDRVSLVCGDPGCTSQPGAAELKVSKERCDVCGGSDTRRALEAFIERCGALGIARVRIVGGSPNYHTELRKMTDGDTRITLKLIRGDSKRNQTEAKADQRHSDLVIVWGGTILDHSTSGNYDSALGRVLVIAHRGIAGMLLRATAEL